MFLFVLYLIVGLVAYPLNEGKAVSPFWKMTYGWTFPLHAIVIHVVAKEMRTWPDGINPAAVIGAILLMFLFLLLSA